MLCPLLLAEMLQVGMESTAEDLTEDVHGSIQERIASMRRAYKQIMVEDGSAVGPTMSERGRLLERLDAEGNLTDRDVYDDSRSSFSSILLSSSFPFHALSPSPLPLSPPFPALSPYSVLYLSALPPPSPPPLLPSFRLCEFLRARSRFDDTAFDAPSTMFEDFTNLGTGKEVVKGKSKGGG